ncbi:MAG: response regulator [Proteobacteria bacterium]|nr:MAG: response regulator [Pseudomonadota bacterium]
MRKTSPTLPDLPHTTRKLKCLLVDDAPENQFLLSKILERLGFHVSIANNGAEAIAMIEASDHDFILMDMEMPVLDGFEATRRLRLSGYGKPIIALTAHSLAEEKVKILACGCDAHLAKPVNFPLLMETISTYTHIPLER